MALRPWVPSGVAWCGVAIQTTYAVWSYVDSAPREALDALASGFAAALLAGIGLVGIVPALLLWRSTSRRAGARTALGVGLGMCLLVFWIPEGLLLLLAATLGWPRRGAPGPTSSATP